MENLEHKAFWHVKETMSFVFGKPEGFHSIYLT